MVHVSDAVTLEAGAGVGVVLLVRHWSMWLRVVPSVVLLLCWCCVLLFRVSVLGGLLIYGLGCQEFSSGPISETRRRTYTLRTIS